MNPNEIITNQYLELAYTSYLGISIFITFVVGYILYRNGKIFLYDAFDRKELADSINRLLLIGYYLINIGYIAKAIKIDNPLNSSASVIEALGIKIGTVLLILGGMHFFNIFVLNNFRKSKLKANALAKKV